ncbi:MAG: cytochrome c oxidase accessory protein CcoG [Alphaproteobacteria bacterium]|nr:MAG: cytochrome c oxidase accessory protein CcoG [Alphaproteobacteria bacterium]
MARGSAQAGGMPRRGSPAPPQPNPPKLYAPRRKIHPKRVNGTFRRIKWAVMVVTLGIYYVTPWLRWDRGPGAPDQAVLLDLPHRRFYFFFIEIWPQEVYYLTGLLILAALALFLATALFGRVWCGYSCPQTVWTDLFIYVERLVQGDRNKRIRLDRAPWTLEKIWKRGLTYAIWLLISVATGGAWVFYFADAPTLARALVDGAAPPAAYISVAAFTFTTFTLGGFLREQVCTYMCPWPRIQGAMFDADTFLVSYRADRGEPRGPHKKGEPWEGRGDCIDCGACVAACPAGIDIRDGPQLECIQCALCIDACDQIMDRVGRPRRLIAYETLSMPAARESGERPRVRLIRPRTVLYSVLILIVSGLMAYGLLTRSDLDLNVLHDRNPLFVRLSDGSIRNGYTLKVLNKAHHLRRFEVAIAGLSEARLKSPELGDAAVLRFEVAPDSVRAVRLFVSLPRQTIRARQDEDGELPITIELRDVASAAVYREATAFHAPGASGR